MYKRNPRLDTIKEALKTSLETVDNLDANITYEFKEGRQGFINGLSQKKNPYPSFTDGHELWQYGFRYQRDNHSDGD